MFCPLCQSELVQANPSKPVLVCPHCKREGQASIDQLAIDRQKPFVRESVDCHGVLLTEDIYCRKCGAKYDTWLTRPEQGR
jgi:DNA-directed RNA polymerase subunit M/transcription elongation factor TFIIS